MGVFCHEEKSVKTNDNLSFVIISLNKITKLKFLFEKKQSLELSAISFFISNWTFHFVETFCLKYINFTKKKLMKKEKKCLLNFS